MEIHSKGIQTTWIAFPSVAMDIELCREDMTKLFVCGNVATREQIGDPLIGHTHWVGSVAESSDGRFVVSRAVVAETIVWDRDGRVIVWRSDDANSTMTNDEAEDVIRSCGHETRHLWPSCFPEYSAEIYCEENAVYSNV